MSVREKGSASEISRERPATSPEAREDQIIALAMDEAEKRIRNGTASNQLLCEFIRMGSTKHKLEKEKLANEVKLVEAKTGSIEAAKKVDEMYAEAIDAMRLYSGHVSDDEEEDYDEY